MPTRYCLRPTPVVIWFDFASCTYLGSSELVLRRVHLAAEELVQRGEAGQDDGAVPARRTKQSKGGTPEARNRDIVDINTQSKIGGHYGGPVFLLLFSCPDFLAAADHPFAFARVVSPRVRVRRIYTHSNTHLKRRTHGSTLANANTRAHAHATPTLTSSGWYAAPGGRGRRRCRPSGR